MNSPFLTTQREHLDRLRAKLHALVNPEPTRTARPIDPVRVGDAEHDVIKMLADVDAEINRGPSAQEYEAQMLNTQPRPGETPEQTAQRLKAENWDNPLVARHTGS